MPNTPAGPLDATAAEWRTTFTAQGAVQRVPVTFLTLTPAYFIAVAN